MLFRLVQFSQATTGMTVILLRLRLRSVKLGSRNGLWFRKRKRLLFIELQSAKEERLVSWSSDNAEPN